MTRTTAQLSVLALALAAGGSTASAQAQASDRIVKALATNRQFSLPACKAAATGGDKNISSGVSALREGVSDPSPTVRGQKFEEAQRSLLAAITRGDKGQSPSAWLYLGRAYLYQGDLIGADSAFARAEKLAPDCKDDIERSRQAAWMPLMNDGIAFANANKPDSASALFHQASGIYRGSPSAYANLGVIFANQGQNDSAAAYFKQAMEIAAKDTTFADEQKFATLNLGIVLNRAKRYDEAIAALEQYRALAPDDKDGATALHSAYCGANQTGKAEALEQKYGLPPCAVAGGDASSLVDKGVAAFNASKFAEAADLFGQAFAKQPYNHDALLNQATAYFRAKNGPRLVETARPLVELEPLNEIAAQLLEQGYRETKQVDKQLAAVSRRRALPVKLETKSVTISPTDIKLGLLATGRDARDPKDQPIRAAPVSLTFELLGTDGAVVAAQEVTVPALAAGATQDVTVAAKANGITGWRYKLKS